MRKSSCAGSLAFLCWVLCNIAWACAIGHAHVDIEIVVSKITIRTFSGVVWTFFSEWVSILSILTGAYTCSIQIGNSYLHEIAWPWALINTQSIVVIGITREWAGECALVGIYISECIHTSLHTFAIPWCIYLLEVPVWTGLYTLL